ncbi:MAG: serine/threonine-protein kinase [Bryobacterales bacterium]|nr:serine/threonine-protein kinase [Bryobacterales bacterium]
MGEVYRALDTRLSRTVAIKVLRADLTEDRTRRERFESEGRAISGLNHPNICTLYDVGRDGDLDYLVMEYLEGETLSGLLARGALPLSKLLEIARQMCAALGHAHARGLVHRDLKPGNIMLTPAGVKLLDFGLAKLVASPARVSEQADTMSLAPETLLGTVMGTAAYMSPEQAEGKRVDTRSDIFSFGAVVYEMATGQRAFRGETAMSTMASILREDPAPVMELRPGLPVELNQIVVRCLRKDPERRFQHIEDVAVALAELGDSPGALAPGAGVPRAASAPVRWTQRRAALAAGLLLLLPAAAGAVWWWKAGRRLPAPLPGLLRLTSDSGLTADPAISRDGRLVAFASDRASSGNLDIWVQQTSGAGAIRLTNDPADDRHPDISPDGSTIAFRSERDGGGIYLVSALGGNARLLAAGGRNPRYSPQGDRIAYWVGEEQNFGSRIFVIPAAGGAARELKLDFQIARSPIWSADGAQLMFYGSTQGFWDWYVAPAAGGGKPVRTRTILAFLPWKLGVVSAGEAPILPAHWDAAGDVLFSARMGDSRGIWKVRVSPVNGLVEGQPQRLTLGTAEDVSPSASGDGSVVFSSQTWSTHVAVLPADANAGRVTGVAALVTGESNVEHYPHVSADGRRLVWESSRVDNRDIWTKDLQTGEAQALVGSPALEAAPRVSRDGTQVAYQIPTEKGQSDLYAISARGGVAKRLCENCGRAASWSRDNRYLLTDSAAPPPFGIALLDVSTGQRTPLLRRGSDIYSPRFSPDDAWIAFHAQTSAPGRMIYVAPFRGAREIAESDWIPITSGQQADREPYWSPDGRLIYFLSDRDGYRCIWAQPVDAATRRPSGDSRPVQHFHRARSSLTNVNWATGLVGFSVARDRLVFALGEVTGNLWMWKP